MKKNFRYLLIILLANVLFLFAPKQECKDLATPCPHSHVKLGNTISFFMSWDAFEFIDCAIDPSLILQPGHTRQSRPLFILAGSTIGYSLYYISYYIHPFLEKKIPETTSGQFSGANKHQSLKILIFLIGFIFINSVLLLITFRLFETIVRKLSGNWKNGQLLFYLLLFFLAGSQLSKIFFWTAHQQMLSLLTPLFCIYITCRLILDRVNYRKTIFYTGIGGIMLLFYGNFIAVLPTILFSQFYVYRKEGTGFSLQVKRYLGVILLFILPTLLWIGFLKMIGVNFYSAEISQYRQFIWIADALNISFTSFLRAAADNTISFFLTWGNLLFIAILFLIQLLYTVLNGRNSKPAANPKKTKEEYLVLLFPALLTLLMVWLLGYYSDRLTFALASPLLCAFAVMVNRQKIPAAQRNFYILYILLSFAYTFFLDSPHFSIDYYH